LRCATPLACLSSLEVLPSGIGKEVAIMTITAVIAIVAVILTGLNLRITITVRRNRRR